MSSYGKKSYWNERYAFETDQGDWLVQGYDIFPQLWTFLTNANAKATAPGGEIIVKTLNAWPTAPLQSLASSDDEEEARQKALCEQTEFPSKKSCRVLHVGCGNSQLGALMLRGGFANIVNVDYSDVVIGKMQTRYADLQSCIEREEMIRSSLGIEPRDGTESRDDSHLHANVSVRTPKMEFKVGDIVTGLPFPDQSFDLIVCKKTLDVILCGAGSVFDARTAMSECFRLLDNDHGVMMILSSAKPEDRAVYFENDQWSGVENLKLPGTGQGHEPSKVDVYCYILYK